MYTDHKFVVIFGKKYGSFSPKVLWRKLFRQNPFPAISRQKKVKALVAWSLKIAFYLGLPLSKQRSIIKNGFNVYNSYKQDGGDNPLLVHPHGYLYLYLYVYISFSKFCNLNWQNWTGVQTNINTGISCNFVQFSPRLSKFITFPDLYYPYSIYIDVPPVQ